MITVNGIPVYWGKSYFRGTFPTGEVNPARAYPVNQDVNHVSYGWGKTGGDEEIYYLFMVGRDLREGAPKARNTLYMEYVPNARLDKARDADGNLLPANRYTAELINAAGFDEVIGVEPHSGEFEKQYRGASTVYPTVQALDQVRKLTSRNVQIVFPDKGAYARYVKLLPGVVKSDIVIIGKHRTNGQIDEIKLEKGRIKPGYDLVIIDDLCSKGGTFYGGANLLRENGATGDIYLIVAHLEQNVCFGELLKEDSPIERIFVCTKSLGEVTHPRVTYLVVKKEVE